MRQVLDMLHTEVGHTQAESVAPSMPSVAEITGNHPLNFIMLLNILIDDF